MPELPEVEVIVRGLRHNFLGLKLKYFKILNKELRYPLESKMEYEFKNKTIKHILRRGKYGLIIFNGTKHLLFHLGMTGKFRFTKDKTTKIKHDHILIEFNRNRFLIYNDVRKFGYFSIIENPINIHSLKKLGPEPSSYNFFKEQLWSKVQQKQADIKSLLLDQSFIAGIGNIYASEILFDCNINPFKLAKKINKQSFNRLMISTDKILNKAIESGGVTIKNYEDITGELGKFQIQLKVYNRNGLACYKCENLIKKTKTKGRSTYYCSNCQK